MSTSHKRKQQQKKIARRKEVKKKLQVIRDFDGPTFLYEPPGFEKMSEVLWDFISPFNNLATTPDHLNGLLSVAIIAWNAALVPGADRQDFVEKCLSELTSDEALQDVHRQIVDELIRRKVRYFAQNQRFIVSYTLTPTPNGPHLHVVSTLEP